MLRLRNLTLAVILLSSIAELNAAIVDTFSVPSTNQGVSSSRSNGFNTSTITQSGLSTTDVVGGSRTFSASTLVRPRSNDHLASVSATMNGAGSDPDFDNVFVAPSHGTDFFVTETEIVWGATTPLNLDIGTDTDFLLTLEDINLSPISLINATLTVRIETAAGTDAVDLALLDSNGLLQPEYRFSGFTGVDFSDIHQITLTLTTTTNKDSSNFIVTYGAFASAAAIPEPSSYLLLGLTAMGAVIVSRRNRNQKKQITAEPSDGTAVS